MGGYWQPTDKELSSLEAKIPSVANLRSERVIVGAQISEPAKNYRQYVAFTLNGHKTIYVHGFCVAPMKDWESHLEVIFDGGTCVWSVLYDVDSQTFSHLTTNGMA